MIWRLPGRIAMNVESAYNNWADQYDSNENKTRDLEAVALRNCLADKRFSHCLEIGCGTEKNTEWLLTISDAITAVDLSQNMLAKAREKISSDTISFQQADITDAWTFARKHYDLAVFSLVLEHIENLDVIFQKLANVTVPGALVYIGELHPFKQYMGSKARFETGEGTQVVTCFNHHITDYTGAAIRHGFEIESIREFFDDENKDAVPRLLVLLFRKKE